MILQIDVKNNKIVERYSDIEVAASWVRLSVDELINYILNKDIYVDEWENENKFIIMN